MWIIPKIETALRSVEQIGKGVACVHNEDGHMRAHRKRDSQLDLSVFIYFHIVFESRLRQHRVNSFSTTAIIQQSVRALTNSAHTDTPAETHNPPQGQPRPAQSDFHLHIVHS